MAEQPSRKPRPVPPAQQEAPEYEGPERRASSSHNGAFAGLPLWSRVIAIVGIPGTLCFFLIWVMADYMPKMYAELVSLRMEAEKSRLIDQQQATQLEQNYRLLQRICSNVSKTDEERQRCFDR